MRKFLTFALLSIAAITGIKLVFMLFNLGEMGWIYFAGPVAIYYFGSYGIPFVKTKEKE